MAVDTTVQVDDAPDGRVRHRGHRPGVAQAGGRHGRGRRDARRDLDRQGRRRGARPRLRHRRQAPRRRGRHRRGRQRARRDRHRQRRRARRAADGDAHAGGRAPRRRGRAARRDVDIVMPQMGESVTEGMVLEWRVAAGDAVADDETLVEISTDKVDAEVPAPAAGTITELARRRGRDRHRRPGARAHEPAPAPPPPRRPPTAPPADRARHRRRRRRRRRGRRRQRLPRRRRAWPPPRASTSTRVAGSGPRGRITKDDVLAAPTARRAPATAQPRSRRRQPLKGGAAMLARYMDESRSIPTATSFRTLTVTTMDGRAASSSRPPARRSPSRT